MLHPAVAFGRAGERQERRARNIACNTLQRWRGGKIHKRMMAPPRRNTIR